MPYKSQMRAEWYHHSAMFQRVIVGGFRDLPFGVEETGPDPLVSGETLTCLSFGGALSFLGELDEVFLV